METEKKLVNQNQEVINKQKLETAFSELHELLGQIESINNVLNLLYSFLSGEDKEIAEPSSALVICMAQLDHIHQKIDELLDIIWDYNNPKQTL